MSKRNIIDALREQHGLTVGQAEATLKTVVEAIQDTLRSDGEVRIHGFGTFKVKERKEKRVSSPITGERIIPAKQVVTFRVPNGKF